MDTYKGCLVGCLGAIAGCVAFFFGIVAMIWLGSCAAGRGLGSEGDSGDALPEPWDVRQGWERRQQR